MSAPSPSLPPVLGLTDIAQRWGRSREFVRLHMRDATDFPDAAGSINGGRNRFWLESDLDAYERRVPSVRADATTRRSSAPRSAGSAPRTGGGAEERLPPEQRAALERMRERYRMKAEGHEPVAFVLAFAFDRKPSFAFRERLKKQGWKFDPKTREWFARVRPGDVDAWRADFTEAGARTVYDEPRYE